MELDERALARKGDGVKPSFSVALTLLAAAALLASGCSSSHPVEAANPEGDRKGAPDFALPDAQGITIRLSDYKGKVVLLDFWATWCGPCMIEIPWFVEFQRRYKDQGFSVIGVSMDDEGWTSVRPFLERFKMNYPVLLGNDDAATAYGGIEVLPTTFLIDRQGRIVETHRGLVNKDTLENAIKSLL